KVVDSNFRAYFASGTSLFLVQQYLDTIATHKAAVKLFSDLIPLKIISLHPHIILVIRPGGPKLCLERMQINICYLKAKVSTSTFFVQYIMYLFIEH
ncbi:hypothetical protein L9F63_024426, partial [Diploptera punctata]